MPVPEWKPRKMPLEDFVQMRDEMGLGTGVSTLQTEYNMSKDDAHQALLALHKNGVFRYFAAEQEDGKKGGYARI